MTTDGSFVPGKFNYAANIWDKEMFSTAWNAINMTENWNFIANTKSFAWSSDPRIEIIHEKIVELGYTGHSGCSFAITLSNMKTIANNGETYFKREYLKNIRIRN